MAEDLLKIAENLWQKNLALTEDETALVVCDITKMKLAQILYQAAGNLGKEAILMCCPTAERAGEEPPKLISEAMKKVDVVICITEHSLTHTKAKKSAVACGVRVATMPGITEDMFTKGAISADYNQIIIRTNKLVEQLNQGKKVVITKADCHVEFSIENRPGIASTGVYQEKGSAGNLPSGEAYIAPIEGSANGTMLVDGSFVGVGKLNEPIELVIESGRLISASGVAGKKILDLLGDGDGRNLAEFGIGTNDKARLTGNVLEDEKIYGTVHLAFGSNHTFGGKIDAGVHLDGVILEPTFTIDNQVIMKNGQFIE